jgi:N utilization substance protein B
VKQRKEGLGKRRRAREMALQMLYQRELGGSPLAEILAAFDLGDYQAQNERADGGNGALAADAGDRDHDPQVEESFDYARRLLTGVDEHAETIDEQIRLHAENWRLERMPVIDRNILRLAIYEMLFEANVPKVVIVDEAIELAKKFGSENSGRFVNGLLDGVLKAVPGESP